jgi:hypothetical protein
LGSAEKGSSAADDALSEAWLFVAGIACAQETPTIHATKIENFIVMDGK